MAFTPRTGNTGTIAFGTSSLTLVVTEIGGYTKTLPMYDGSHINTSGHAEMYPGVVYTSEPIEVRVWFNPGVNLASLGTSETITLTYPKSGTGNNAATLAGTGVIISDGTAPMAMGALMT
jgi:hypothetical protein